jgi:predicted transcriptional regulator of viral defense system
MRAQTDTRPVRGSVLRERGLADLARRQYGVISWAQARELGMSRGAIRHRLDSRRWRSLHRGVYAVGSGPLTKHGRWLAAVLAAGEGAVLSHWSAAALWEIAKERPGRSHVTAPSTRCMRESIVVHRVTTLAEDDRVEHGGIPVTSLARTLLDLASVGDRVVVARAADEADRLRLLAVEEVLALLQRMQGRRGSRRLRDVLARHTEPAPTRSELESRFLDLIADAGLPHPAVNSWVAGFEIDAVWAKERLAVELDGWGFHRSRMAFERDHARDTRLRLAGYEVVRFTWRQLRDEPTMVIALVRRALRTRRPA